MQLTIDEVKHIAKLSRLHLTDEEVEKFRHQLSAILEYVKKLNEIDTTGYEPTINTTGLQDILREDIVQPSLTNQQALQNTKKTHDGYFVVPHVFE